MTAEELITHPSIQRELSRFCRLGGKITMDGSNITLHVQEIIPVDIAEAFMLRIQTLDTKKQLRIFIAK